MSQYNQTGILIKESIQLCLHSPHVYLIWGLDVSDDVIM